MPDFAPKRMTADEFITWAMTRPDDEHYELVAGEIVAMAPERSEHGLTKFRIGRRLAEAIEAASLRCTVYLDGMSVSVDQDTVYEPDVLVRCGDKLPRDAVAVTDPLIVVEVRSPSTGDIDAGLKLTDYFRISTVRHYLIVDLKRRAVVHHERDMAGTITTRIVRDGAIRLDPPGIDLTDFFEEEP